jgi:hypothetical protein
MKQSRLSRAWSAWLALPVSARIAAVIFVACMIGLFLLPSPARADLIARNGANGLRLMPRPCDSAAVLADVGPTLAAKMRAAHARVDGQEFEGCWIEYEGSMFVIYEDADRSTIPVAAFKNEPGV